MTENGSGCMMYSRRAYASPVRHMLHDMPHDSFVNAHVVLQDKRECDIPRITDCRETSDGKWIVFAQHIEDREKATFLKKRDVQSFYVFYVHTPHDTGACA
ncbi:hypothetical protein [Methanohalophilus sp. DAL1]|uniref:hypothetical protein n=1 Tax=Methanohalophilus sp. DAL1 TaxID=1864608 RepID=UPI0025B9E18A|nr:hypothetical protein [Methanohalophilus sp. DAL1]